MALTDNLIACYKCDESGTTAPVDSVNSYNLTQTASKPTYAAGKINNGIVFDRSNSQGAYYSNIGAGAKTTASVSLWAKWTDTNDCYAVELAKTSANYNQLSFKLNDNLGAGATGRVSCLIYDGSSAGVLSTSTGLNDGNWHHLAYVLDGATQYIYVDNVATSASSGNKSIELTQLALAYTKINNTQFYSGMLDEIGIWSRALSAAEISLLWNGGNGISWPFISGPANLKSYNTNLKANIKTINTNPIANVKTLNTNS